MGQLLRPGSPSCARSDRTAPQRRRRARCVLADDTAPLQEWPTPTAVARAPRATIASTARRHRRLRTGCVLLDGILWRAQTPAQGALQAGTAPPSDLRWRRAQGRAAQVRLTACLTRHCRQSNLVWSCLMAEGTHDGILHGLVERQRQGARARARGRGSGRGRGRE